VPVVVAAAPPPAAKPVKPTPPPKAPEKKVAQAKPAPTPAPTKPESTKTTAQKAAEFAGAAEPKHTNPAPTPTPPATGIEPADQIKVTFKQANLAGMDSASVTFKTGLKVPVGETFPSGEKLLSVSPSERKIVTSRRVIILLPDEQGAKK